MPLEGVSGVENVRSVVFYEAGGDGADVPAIPSAVVADSEQISIFRFRYTCICTRVCVYVCICVCVCVCMCV